MAEIFDFLFRPIICLLIGCLVGYCELFNRYQDEPSAINGSSIAKVFIFINGLASLIAFFLIWHYNDTFFKERLDDVKIILLSGFSGLVFLRSSLFSVRAGNKDIPIGPAALLTILLNGIDRLYDRERARDRAMKINEVMDGIDFDKAEVDLSVACLNLMQNLSLEEQQKMKEEVQSLSQSSDKFSVEKTKSIILGLIIVKYTGFKTLEQAISMIGDQIKSKKDENKEQVLDNFLQKKAKELEE